MQEMVYSCKTVEEPSVTRTTDEPAYILSFGAGVNTVALMVMLIKQGSPLDGVVFADTGGETPATYEAVRVARDYLEGHGVPFTVVSSRPKETDLYGTALRRRVIPSAKWRWCTRDFKVRPIHRYYRGLDRHINQYIGIAFDEVHRMKDSQDDYITNLYPLIEQRMTRHGLHLSYRGRRLACAGKERLLFLPFQFDRALDATAG